MSFVDKGRFSSKLKQALAHFNKEIATPQISNEREHTTCGKITSNTTSVPDKVKVTPTKKSITGTQNQLYLESSNLSNKEPEPADMHIILGIQQQLKTALNRIDHLEQEVLSLKQDNNQLQMSTSQKVSSLEQEVTLLKKANNQLQMSTGPRISDLLKRIDELENCDTRRAALDWRKIAENLPEKKTTNKEPESQTENLNKTTQEKPIHQRVTFMPNKCVVIHDIRDKSQAGKDNNIRRMVGQNKSIIIDRITHRQNGNVMVQLGEENMVEQVISAWDPTSFGSSKIRRTIDPSQRNGVLKGVPTDITEEVIKEELEKQGYADTEPKRYLKANRPTSAVKVRFATQKDLEKAIQHRVLIDHLTIKVETISSRVSVISCYNCLKFGHKAAECTGSRSCRQCSEPFDESHDNCEKRTKCVNCKGEHRSMDKNCPKYREIYQREEKRREHLNQVLNHG